MNLKTHELKDYQLVNSSTKKTINSSTKSMNYEL